jgi:hypothetical protein
MRRSIEVNLASRTNLSTRKDVCEVQWYMNNSETMNELLSPQLNVKLDFISGYGVVPKVVVA